MWLYFNKNGQLVETLTHGTYARVGTNVFEIFVAFDPLLNKNNRYTKATLTLFKPDLGKTPALEATSNITSEPVEFVKDEGDGDLHYLQDGMSYNGFLFDFADYEGSEEFFSIFDMSGYWTAVITLTNESGTIRNVLDNCKFLCY